MSKTIAAVVVDTERCKGCSLCIVACPLNLLRLVERKVNHKGYPYVEQTEWERCTGCTACAMVCPDGCLSVYRKRVEQSQEATVSSGHAAVVKDHAAISEERAVVAREHIMEVEHL